MIGKELFGYLADGRPVTRYSLQNAAGESVEFLDYGAAIHSLLVRDPTGELADILLGVTDPSEMEPYAPEGVTIGRCANTIAFGQYELDGRTVTLEKNFGEHQLHSASGCYATKFFQADPDEENNTISFHLHDDGAGGFDCEADASVRYRFTDDHRLEIKYEITPHGDTIINPSNHAYFNLSGADDVRDHHLRICTAEYAPKGKSGVPEGGILPVSGTPLDFTEARTLRQAIDSDGNGYFSHKPEMYDACLILSKSGFGLAAELSSQKSGRVMRVYTDMPALVLFTPTFPMPGKIKPGKARAGYSSLCLETQFVPNAVNCPQYLSPICRKGHTFASRTVYEFSTL
jgi:aldose 1-epimerase